eukprot:909352-Ditylum_brightwellii.AAC.2
MDVINATSKSTTYAPNATTTATVFSTNGVTAQTNNDLTTTKNPTTATATTEKLQSHDGNNDSCIDKTTGASSTNAATNYLLASTAAARKFQ